MSTATPVAHWPREIETWLDGHGKGAWIAVMVLGFIVFWPIGLALLAYMIWGKQMFKRSCRSKPVHKGRSSGNMAFDAYKADTLKRLEDEQAAFESFLERLRSAKDKAEFDAFMDENRRRREDAEAQPERADG